MEPGATYGALDVSNGSIHAIMLPKDAAGRIKYLDASKNQLLSLQEISTQLQQLTCLQQLVLARNRLADICGLELLLDLRVLNLARNRIQDLQPLEALTRVKDLDIHSNCINSLAPLSTLTGLVTLNAAANRLQDLPCLTGLTQLTQLNLRHNLITQLTPAATAPAAACAAAAAAAGSLDTGLPCSSQSSCSLLPCSMQRLSLAFNQLQDVSTLTVLRQLPSLLDLCVDSNPFTAASRNQHPAATAATAAAAAAAASSSSKGTWYREAVLLAACTPALLRLDGQPVSPTERALLLTTSASLHAAKVSQHKQSLSIVLSTQQLGLRPQSARPLQPHAATVAGNPGHSTQQLRTRPQTASPGLVFAAIAGTAANKQSTCSSPDSLLAACAEDRQKEDVVEYEEAATTTLAAVLAAEQGPAQEQQPEQGLQGTEDAVAAQDTSSACKQQETAGHRTQCDQQQQRRLSTTLHNQGSLKDAALTCGIDMPADATVRIFAAAAAAAGSKQPVAGSRCPSAAAPAAAVAVATDSVETGAPDVQGVFIGEADVDEYLQVEKARLTARTRSGPPPTPPPATTPGMELLGRRCALTGNVLHLLKGEGLAGVTDLTLSHVPYAEVLAALPSLLALRRLKALSLVSNTGLSTLPQLHPMLQLRKLCHLTIQDCPICNLVLLRPYMAFRFTALQSFNGVAFTADEAAEAGRLFAALEATLETALDQTPQQAALKAAGIQLSSSKQHPSTAGPTESNSHNAALLQRFSCSRTAAVSAAATGRPDSSAAASSSSSSRVTHVLAAMRGPLLPAAAEMEQGQQFAKQVLSEAAVVQQQLAEFQEVTWPALLEASIHKAWSGNPAGFQH